MSELPYRAGPTVPGVMVGEHQSAVRATFAYVEPLETDRTQSGGCHCYVTSWRWARVAKKPVQECARRHSIQRREVSFHASAGTCDKRAIRKNGAGVIESGGRYGAINRFAVPHHPSGKRRILGFEAIGHRDGDSAGE